MRAFLTPQRYFFGLDTSPTGGRPLKKFSCDGSISSPGSWGSDCSTSSIAWNARDESPPAAETFSAHHVVVL